MAAYSFSSIKTNSDLDKVIMQLRLRKLPLTLDVINAIRVAIQTPHLDEKLHKTLEREFSGKWKEIQKKHRLTEWPKNRLGRELTQEQPTIPEPIMKKVQRYAESYTKKVEKPKTSTNTKKSKKRKKGRYSTWPAIHTTKSVKMDFPCKLEVPYTIENIQQANDILNILKKFPNRITYSLKYEILSHIRSQVVLHYFLDNLAEIREVFIFEQERKTYNINHSQGTIIPPKRKFVAPPKKKDEGNLYDKFEYGLSDWDN